MLPTRNYETSTSEFWTSSVRVRNGLEPRVSGSPPSPGKGKGQRDTLDETQPKALYWAGIPPSRRDPDPRHRPPSIHGRYLAAEEEGVMLWLS